MMGKEYMEPHSITLDPEIWRWVDEKIKDGVGTSRAGVIRYYLMKARELDKLEPRAVAFLIDFLKIVEAQPELVPELRTFLEHY